MEVWAPGHRVVGAPLVSLAHQGAPSNGLEPQKGPWQVGPRMVDGALTGRGSSLTHVEVIAGSWASREGRAHEGALGEAEFLSFVLLPRDLDQPAGASWPDSLRGVVKSRPGCPLAAAW